MRKLVFDIVFIACATVIFILLLEYGLLEKYIAFSLIPILIAYYLGQFSARKYGRG